MAASAVKNPSLFESADSIHGMYFCGEYSGFRHELLFHRRCCVLCKAVTLIYNTLSAHTNNFSGYCLQIVGARRMAQEDAMTKMAQHQQWRGATLSMARRNTNGTIKQHQWRNATPRRCCVLRKAETMPCRTFSAHTNNFSGYCLQIVGARRMAQEDAMTIMAQHQQWRGATLSMARRNTNDTIKQHQWRNATPHHCCALPKVEKVKEIVVRELRSKYLILFSE